MPHQFTGRLTTRDCKRNIIHPFVVPANTGQLDLHFHFAPHHAQAMTNWITLTLFDPHGFRGAGHRYGDSHRLRLDATSATPGYLPGPLPAGEWQVQIDTHMIMPGEPVHYWLDVTLTESAGAEQYPIVPASARPNLPLRGPGWYRGDLHSHTHHSDAGERTVAQLVQSAREAGLDFVFLTDHNTTAGLAQIDALASAELLTAGGIELTTFWGHALCLGTRTWVDWRMHPGDGQMPRLAAAAYANEQVFIIAHPQAVGDPACTGCNWRFGEMMPGNARLVEIWNGPWDCDSNNEAALSLWYDWLNQGRRLTATAGTDTHSAQDYTTRSGFNVVYAEALTEAALFKALLAGHLYLSAGPQLTFEARAASGQTWISGDTVTQPVTVAIAWANCPPTARLRLLANGRLLHQQPAGGQGNYEQPMSPDQADWLVVEIRGENGHMLAITNPIFLQQNT